MKKAAAVKPGIERLMEVGHPFVQGARIGLLTNPTGIDSRFRTSVELCGQLPGAKLTALYACEHGLYGQRQAGVRFDDEWEPTYGVPVFSLYGKVKKPTPDMLEPVDTVIFDMQDIGVRFYTYLSSLLYMMEACAETGRRLLVLDRPNPLGGMGGEGGLLKNGFESMVGAWTMPFRTGLTIGELAVMANEQRGIGCELEVVKLEGWNRRMEYADTGLPWMLPSPNIPSIDTVRVYPGTCLFEGTNVSEGRGTTRPFEWIGAPWMDGEQLAKRLNAAGLQGVIAHPVYATPMFSKHAGELCGGIRLFITDPVLFRSVHTGIALLGEIKRLHPDRFEWLPPFREGMKPFIDLLSGSEHIRCAVGDRLAEQELLESWSEDERCWNAASKLYYKYGV